MAYTLLLRGLTEELVLIDSADGIAEGEALDLRHSQGFSNHRMVVRSGNLQDAAGSDMVVLTCSVPWSPDYTSRLQLGRDNVKIFRRIVPPLSDACPQAKLLIVTNPVDVMTYYAIKLSGFPRDRVFGTGTLIDSARFRTMLSAKMEIHPDDLRAYILGEHGASQFPVFSMAVAGGTRILENKSTHEIFDHASRSGFDVVNRKGHTNYAIAMAAALVVEAIAWDTNRTMPLSVLVDGFLEVSDVCLSLPVVVGKSGITRVLEPNLGEDETAAFHKCAKIVRQAIEELSEQPSP